jgi:hypothetical protein
MPAARVVEPEWLDSLPHDHPDARGNRRDIRRINHLQGNFAWMAGQVRRHVRAGMRLLEVGAGAGDLGARLRSILPAGCVYAGLDLAPRPEHWPGDWPWLREDLAGFDAYDGYDVILANLILHQFEDPVLARIGRRWRRAGVTRVLARETVRSPVQERLVPLGRLLGMNAVSRHDAAVSVRAGFRGHELPRLLGLAGADWKLCCGAAPLRAYHLRAIRPC